MTDILTALPPKITSGNTLAFVITHEDYPASDSWVLSFVLLNATNKITLTSTADDDGHSFSIADTSAYVAGEYTYTALVSNGVSRYTVDVGSVEILPDPATLTTYDGRSVAQVCLDNINAVLQNKATQDNFSYSIAGRSLSKYSWTELIEARNYYQNEVSTAKRKASGKTQSNLIKMRFV